MVQQESACGGGEERGSADGGAVGRVTCCALQAEFNMWYSKCRAGVIKNTGSEQSGGLLAGEVHSLAGCCHPVVQHMSPCGGLRSEGVSKSEGWLEASQYCSTEAGAASPWLLGRRTLWPSK